MSDSRIHVHGMGWALFWLFCITLNTCDGASVSDVRETIKQEIRR